MHDIQLMSNKLIRLLILKKKLNLKKIFCLYFLKPVDKTIEKFSYEVLGNLFFFKSKSK